MQNELKIKIGYSKSKQDDRQVIDGNAMFQKASKSLSVLLHKLYKSLLMHQARITPILKDAQVAQSELDEALINKVYRGVDIESKRSLGGRSALIHGQVRKRRKASNLPDLYI
jgi:hypothetical protein